MVSGQRQCDQARILRLARRKAASTGSLYVGHAVGQLQADVDARVLGLEGIGARAAAHCAPGGRRGQLQRAAQTTGAPACQLALHLLQRRQRGAAVLQEQCALPA